MRKFDSLKLQTLTNCDFLHNLKHEARNGCRNATIPSNVPYQTQAMEGLLQNYTEKQNI